MISFSFFSAADLLEKSSTFAAVLWSIKPLIMDQVALKKRGAFTITILFIVSGKHRESINACFLMISRVLLFKLLIASPLKSKMETHSNLVKAGFSFLNCNNLIL